MKSKINSSKTSAWIRTKNFLQLTALFLLIVALFSSCEVIGDIFKAGMGVGIFIVIAVIVLIVFIISKLGGKK